MFSLGLSVLSLTPKQKQRKLNPEEFMFKLGTYCKFCDKKILYSNSISICQCKQYGHLECIKNILNTHKLRQNDIVSCKTCRKDIQITYEKQIKIGLKVRFQNSVLIVFLCIAIFFLVEQIQEEFKHKPNQRDLVSLSFEVSVGIILLIGLLIMVFLSVIYSDFKIKNIKRSKNSVIASAFEGIQTVCGQENCSSVIFT